MFENTQSRLSRGGLFAMILLGFSVIVPVASQAAGSAEALVQAPVAAQASVPVLRFDVVQNGVDFFFEGPVNEAGFPAKGTPFVTTGYVYPGGTLAAYGSDTGVLANGEPEFPNLVLGTWICRGWHLLDGDAETGIVVVTTQTFDLDDERIGRQMIVTDGIELADFDKPFVRPITGGSGRFGRARGEMRQTYVDFNASGGFNMSFQVELN